MPAISPRLQELRDKLNQTDQRLHDLLIERLELVRRVTEEKANRGAPAYDPTREAMVVRARAEYRPGQFPVGTLLRVWREILGRMVQEEEKFSISVYAPNGASGVWDLARDHFGSQAPLIHCTSPKETFEAVLRGDAKAGVLLQPQSDDPEPWVLRLLPVDTRAPHIIASLPIVPDSNARSDGRAFVIAYADLEATGRDRTCFLLENTVENSFTKLKEVLVLVGLKYVSHVTFAGSVNSGDRQSMITFIEVEGFVTLSEVPIARMRSEAGFEQARLIAIGGYARPLA
jgi:chorismate mutase